MSPIATPAHAPSLPRSHVAWLHAGVDRLAMWTEDRHYRPRVAFTPGTPDPLDCFGPLPPRLPALPPAPDGATWEAPSPRPTTGDPRMLVEVTPAAGARRGTTVLVPPWKLPRLSLVSGWAALAARAGNEVWTLVPPLHLQRAPPGTRSGEDFVTPDLPAMRAATEQLVLEIRLLLALARARREPVGLLGLSLGGLAAALAATTPEAPDFCALVAPPADLRAVALETRIGRRLLRPLGRPLSPEALAGMLRPFGPGERPPRAGRVLVAVGAADAIALPAPAEALARAWGAELRAYPRGHLTLLFACRAVRRDVQELLRPPA